MILSFVGVPNSYAQDDITSDTSHVQHLVLTTAYSNEMGMILRWAPQSPGKWREGNFYGYKIERALQNGDQGTGKWEVIESQLKPISLDKWRALVLEHTTDTFLMVAGQAVHGAVNGEALSPQNMMDKADQLTNLHAACLLSCEFSRHAGLAAALRYEDKTAVRGLRYLYRISCNNDPMLQAVSISNAEEETYPAIENIEVREGENAIELKWNRDYYKNFYTGFYIYRSSDEGNSWQKITPHPTARVGFKDVHHFIFKDSLASNYQPYWYKIEGLTSFAGKGPQSAAVKAMGRDRTAPDAPYDVRLDYLGNAMMKISWKVNESDQDIKGFRISKSNEQQKEFVEITPKILPGNVRSYIDSTCNENINNYYWIAVIDHEDNVNVTMPQYGTIIDSIPPLPPTGIEGNVDTNGVVTLRWKKGGEVDLKGYFVHYANNARHTFINRTDKPLQDTFWRDTIPLNVLTEQIHYKVVAIDHRFNYSGYSEMITLSKPDKVPPTSPVFQRSIVDDQGVHLQWANSGSHDVKYNVLMRRSEGEEVFIEIYRCGPRPSTSNYTDTKIIGGKKYEYTLYAVDDAGLQSDRISTLSLKAFENKKLDIPQNFQASVDTIKRIVTLSWKNPAASTKTAIYRSVNDQPWLTHKVVANVSSFMDVPYRKGDVVKYRIKAMDDRGAQSNFTESTVVNTNNRQ